MTCAPPQALADAAGAREPLDQLDRELVGLAPVKGRIRDVAALLLVDRLRASHCLQAGTPTLHMCFTGNHGLASRITHHIDFPNHSEAGLLQFAQLMPDRLHYRFDDGAVTGTSQ